MMNPVIVSGYMGAGVGYIYGYMQSKNTEYPFPYNLYYSKKKISLFYILLLVLLVVDS